MMSVLLTGSPFENCVTFYCFGILKNTINKKSLTQKCQTHSFQVVRTVRLELTREAHTPLKRARIPIPPCPQLSFVFALFPEG